MMIWDIFFLDVFGHFGPFEVSFFFVWLWMLLSQDGQTFVLLSGRPRETRPLSLYLDFLSFPIGFSRRLTLNTSVAGVASNPCTCQLHLGCTLTNCQALVVEKEIQVLPNWEENLKDFHCLLVHICTPWGLKIPSSWGPVFPINFACFRMRVTTRGLFDFYEDLFGSMANDKDSPPKMKQILVLESLESWVGRVVDPKNSPFRYHTTKATMLEGLYGIHLRNWKSLHHPNNYKTILPVCCQSGIPTTSPKKSCTWVPKRH